MPEENMYDKLRTDCWNKAIDCFGYAFIFNLRVKKYGARIKLLVLFGLIVPALVGIFALSYAYNKDLMNLILLIATPLTIIQFAVSVYSVVYKWDDSLSYSLDAFRSYTILSEKFKEMGNTPPPTYEELKGQYRLIEVEYNQRSAQDAFHTISEWEKRKGMKAALRQFQRKCIGCNSIPLSLENSDCDVCGNFSFKYKYLKL